MLSRKTTNVLKKLGILIRQQRGIKGMSQAALAERMGVTRQTVMAIEKGESSVSLGSAFEAAHIVGIPIFSESNLEGMMPEKLIRKKPELSDDF